VDFRNCIIVMTSNIGAKLIKKSGSIGFTSRSDEAKTQQMEYGKMKEKLLDELKKTFRPEFLNRIDGVVVFHSLTKEHIRRIVDLMLAQVSQQLAEKEIKLEVTDAAKDFLGEKGYDEVFGARPLRRVIQDMVEDKLSEAVLRNEFKAFDKVYEVEAEMTEASPAVLGAIKALKGVLSVESSEKMLTVYSSDDLKAEIEKIGQENGDILAHLKMHGYVSKALVDVADNEIVLKTDEAPFPGMAVGALLGDDKA
jgi:hypothetical protein